MEQQHRDTERVMTSFETDIQMYKANQISKKDFVHKLIRYTVSLYALNFLVLHVLLEMRTAIEKGTPLKDTMGEHVLEDPSLSGSQFNFGIEGFLGGSSHRRLGDGGIETAMSTSSNSHSNLSGSYDTITYRRNDENNNGQVPR